METIRQLAKQARRGDDAAFETLTSLVQGLTHEEARTIARLVVGFLALHVPILTICIFAFIPGHLLSF